MDETVEVAAETAQVAGETAEVAGETAQVAAETAHTEDETACVLDAATVLEAMRDVIDPELGYNIADLGLIYEIHVSERNVIEIVMTMTTPGCPAQDYIMRGVYERCLLIDGVSDVKIELRWQPRWSPQMMSLRAKVHFRVPERS